MKPGSKLIATALLGVCFGALVMRAGLYFSAKGADRTVPAKEVLHWVAPMDPNFKRDKPGKSPMGMDLVPVYKETQLSAEPGTIRISPTVVNNLGVRTGEAAMRSLQSNIETVGYVRFDEDRLVHIHPRVAGWVDKLYVKAAGNPVKEHQALYSLYSPELVSAQEEYLLATRQSGGILAENAVERLRALQFPEASIDTFQRTRKVQQTVIFLSPQAGVIDHLDIREGFYVHPGTTMMSIGSLDEVWVLAEIVERQAYLLKEGQSVTLSMDYLPGESRQAVVDYVYPTLDSATRTVRVRIRVKNTDKKLKPNMYVKVLIHAAQQAQAVLTVPLEAVVRTEHQNRVVLALGEGQFKSVAIKTGAVGENHIEVREGLEAGDRIVTSAQFLLDSESSKNSDFRRMESSGENAEESVWVAATVTEVMPEEKMLALSHAAIESWNMMAMTMHFSVADAIELDKLQKGMMLDVEITRDDTQYTITDVRAAPGGPGHD